MFEKCFVNMWLQTKVYEQPVRSSSLDAYILSSGSPKIEKKVSLAGYKGRKHLDLFDVCRQNPNTQQAACTAAHTLSDPNLTAMVSSPPSTHS